MRIGHPVAKFSGPCKRKNENIASTGAMPRRYTGRMMPTIAKSLDDALAPITDGCMLVVPRESLGRADGGDARADPPRRQAAASGRAADLEPAGRPADRRRLRRDAGDVAR